jgi:predicted metal-binding membrane protein
MALLFAAGVMNRVWIAALAVAVLIEKVVPGVLLVGAGLWVAVARVP